MLAGQMGTFRHPLSIVLALGLAWAAVPSAQVASAQADGEQDARHHFRLGSAHHESGHFEEAADEFEESYRLSHRPELLHNIYVAHRDAGNAAQAANALERYLAAMPDLENRAMLERRLVGLRRMAAAGQTSSETNAETAASQEAASSESPSSSEHDTASVEIDEAAGGGLSPVGFIVAGIGAAALIGGAITGALAMSAESELESNCPDGACPPGYDYMGPAGSGRTLALTTDILIPVGVAAVAAGVVLILVLDGGGDEGTSAGAACTADGCMGVLRGTF